MAKTTTLTNCDCVSESFDKKILILDDVPLVGRTVASQLRLAGFANVRFETDARLAMEVISEFQPDMILLDIFMPHISGLELLQQIRSDEKFNHIIVLIICCVKKSIVY